MAQKKQIQIIWKWWKCEEGARRIEKAKKTSEMRFGKNERQKNAVQKCPFISKIRCSRIRVDNACFFSLSLWFGGDRERWWWHLLLLQNRKQKWYEIERTATRSTIIIMAIRWSVVIGWLRLRLDFRTHSSSRNLAKFHSWNRTKYAVFAQEYTTNSPENVACTIDTVVMRSDKKNIFTKLSRSSGSDSTISSLIK